MGRIPFLDWNQLIPEGALCGSSRNNPLDSGHALVTKIKSPNRFSEETNQFQVGQEDLRPCYNYEVTLQVAEC